jgi:GTP cyclohydrolase I
MAQVHKLKIKPSQTKVEEAVRTLLAWAGDDPDRQGLKDHSLAGSTSIFGVVQRLRRRS